MKNSIGNKIYRVFRMIFDGSDITIEWRFQIITDIITNKR